MMIKPNNELDSQKHNR